MRNHYPVTLLRGIILVIQATSVINGCSQIDKVPLEGNIKISHLVITGKITNVIKDGTSYLADVLRVFKDSGKKFDRSILITQIGTRDGGQCFENNFKVNRTYILFLRELATNVFRPYSEELLLSKLPEVIKACADIDTCRTGYDPRQPFLMSTRKMTPVSTGKMDMASLMYDNNSSSQLKSSLVIVLQILYISYLFG